MRLEDRYIVKVLAPMIGRPASPRRVRVLTRAHTLEAALILAHHRRGRVGEAFWIEASGEPATTPGTRGRLVC